MKKILLILIIAGPITVVAQATDTTYWKKGGVASLNFSQVTLNNWAGGGNNSIAFNGYLNVFANFKKGRSIWDNTMELGYGLIKQDNAEFVKSDDKINFTTKYGRQLKKDKDKLYWSMNFNLRSQFDEGFNPDETSIPISKFMAPGYLTIALGLDWKPSKYFSLSYAPLTGKITIVNDQDLADSGAYGVDPAKLDGSGIPIAGTGSKSRKEFGSYLTASFKKEIFENVSLTSNLQMFSNYVDDPKGIDVNWENALLMKINKYLSASIINQLIYDNDIKVIEYDDAGLPTGESAKVQLKNIFGLGLAYTFGDKQ